MATTSLKLSNELKQRAAAAAKEQGISAHAFMVTAIEQAATAAEQRARLMAAARAARRETLEGGEGYAADDVHTYIKARAVGIDAAKPDPLTWRK